MRALCLAFLLLAAPAFPGPDPSNLPPATGFASLKLLRGARPAAMAGAYTSVADDALSIQYNPAGLTELREAQLSLSHMAWLDGVKDESLNLGLPIFGLGAWGLAMNYLSASDDGRDGFGTPNGSFSVSDMSLAAAFALQLGDNGAFGFDYKLLRQDYAGRFNMGSCFDLGASYKGFFNRMLALSIASQSMGTNMALGGSYAPLPWVLKGGLGLRPLRGLNLACDYDYQPMEFMSKVRIGGEYTDELGDETDLSFRAGYIFGPENAAGGMSGMSAGLGFHWGAWRVDYAFVPKGDLGTSHLFSLSFGFGQH